MPAPLVCARGPSASSKVATKQGLVHQACCPSTDLTVTFLIQKHNWILEAAKDYAKDKVKQNHELVAHTYP